MAVTVTPANVRNLLDVSLDATTLPDATVNLDIYKGVAIREVKRRVAGADGLTGDDALRVSAAADYLTSALIAPAVPALTREDYGEQGGYSRAAFDPIARAAELRQMADDEIAEVLQTSITDKMPTMFAKASGERGF